MGVGASKRGGDDSLAALLERRAFDVLQQRTDRVMLVLANVTDPAVELQILQCADSMGVQVIPLRLRFQSPRPDQHPPRLLAASTPLNAYVAIWWVETSDVQVPTHYVLLRLPCERHLAPQCFSGTEPQWYRAVLHSIVQACGCGRTAVLPTGGAINLPCRQVARSTPRTISHRSVQEPRS
jgi:hypothetical protein